ncbi:bifunctional anthranilate synthase/indole-3-glycerol-phosphate synthase [Sugiyamaella lignohabitans]|uniref:Multifunctional tryptophan biosynthesis protein n=1 Tax=Sugiyamaella lignohabitans TaxID=796027 RepID=A0A170QZP3_9ASCO|nr:bifunctional anthranilate synthase/indole-3-glycerol-phosphate synthase [Sugiyamaella lignohabitans]ANB16019.1 bifunctional anthranilate synthase/indole-3-glycerol-phosphate synthase [Sugiyamaella lignohabitans]
MTASSLSQNVVMIDNYDSFTWNLYEYLCREGANVQVFRNDKITVEEIAALNPDRILISPGPGHPLTDAGISCDAIKYFAGKIPVIGVCMGQQCMVTVFGGEVKFAGEIVHGKTSTITHDSKGIFEGASQHIAVTRYHSLAGNPTSIPECLDVSATSDTGIIMGVRHKEYTVEGVQFHPESILTEEGRKMVRNFLTISGGTWKEHQANVAKAANNSVSSNASQANGSILNRIFEQRKKDVEEAKKVPGRSFKELEKSLKLGLAPTLIDFADRLSHQDMSVMAEIKRASPSKGPIGLSVHAPTQARIYAEAGAATISVLTEPHWFLGSLEDLRLARLAVDSLPNRPAILRKEFIFDEYQILEARLAGADTVLLIVKMLDDSTLERLYKYSKSLGMEPLVEVASAEELTRANAIGSKVIGVNNRDLHSFNVDLNTTSSLVSNVPDGVILAALSGITSNAEVSKYAKDGVRAVLVGEALMKADDPSYFLKSLLA